LSSVITLSLPEDRITSPESNGFRECNGAFGHIEEAFDDCIKLDLIAEVAKDRQHDVNITPSVHLPHLTHSL
jgi:hypothetical protein